MSKQFVLCGDNYYLLQHFPDNFFDSIVTDSPYGLGKPPDIVKLIEAWMANEDLEIKGKGFMGKDWDKFVPQPKFWKEVFRVLKPGGFLVSFFGTRTYDIGTLAIRLAGFEIKDCLSWMYATGFPKSLNVSIAIDKELKAEREVIGTKTHPTSKDRTGNKSPYQNEAHLDGNSKITTPKSPEAQKFAGYGTALKPAFEPIVLARKPISERTVALNVLKWGTGALNIDGCKIGDEIRDSGVKDLTGMHKGNYGNGAYLPTTHTKEVQGRFPANVLLECICDELYQKTDTIQKADDPLKTRKVSYLIHTNPDCPCCLLDKQSGITTSGAVDQMRNETQNNVLGKFGAVHSKADSSIGYASRFFYTAKASRSERDWGLEGNRYELNSNTPAEIITQINRLLNNAT